ncbi:uncharacterized protein LOC128992258 [Macrosteles quadrilineatus]|uniref:uncharacterized protein LOC128992258 n=1 Tax=Macrosteles quadrilineatus TaxID=74068 RepID=UPI0023E0E81D|nr:uncharacterized protein LOC128992258 [Macrosteles quadrilineatus]
MGAQIAKELGVYNEEEKICTPKNVGRERYRLLYDDPRSVTAGITRTPIQVECTPTGVKSSSRSRSIIQSESSFSNEAEVKKQDENDSGYKEEVEVSEELKEENRCVTPELVRYLETDIDKVDSPVNAATPLKTVDSSPTDIHHSTLITEEKPEPLMADLLSPTVTISRTPHLVECTPELFALHSRIDSMSFCDFDAHIDDPSAIVSDDENSSPRNQSTINKWLFGVENKLATPGNDSFADSPKTVAKKQKELNALKKQLFFTPDIRVTEPVKPKARTPLGDLQAGQLRESPQRMLKAKQWRNVADERKRRGLVDAENTPPNQHLPPLTSVASAPGKITERKRNKINWDSENAMMI